MRTFAGGATRNCDKNKYDYEGFFSPLMFEAFAEYMHAHRMQADGNLRASDNWQAGIGCPVYMKSLWRHFFDLWKIHRGLPATSPEDGHAVTAKEACCAIIFNTQGYLHETLKAKP